MRPANRLAEYVVDILDDVFDEQDYSIRAIQSHNHGGWCIELELYRALDVYSCGFLFHDKTSLVEVTEGCNIYTLIFHEALLTD